jgi:hypothetical protein
MRFLMRLQMPTEAENPDVAAPDFNDRMRLVLQQIKAERASFGIVDGRRVDSIIVNVADATELPAKAAPFYRWLKARAEFLPQMSAEDVEKMKPRFDALRRQREAEAKTAEAARTDLDSFLRGEVDGKDFHHAHHVEAAFAILRRHDFDTALKAYADALKVMTARSGNPYAYHETITVAFMTLIAERAAPFADYDSFILANPDLLDKDVLLTRYSRERLHSDAARQAYLPPDR